MLDKGFAREALRSEPFDILSGAQEIPEQHRTYDFLESIGLSKRLPLRSPSQTIIDPDAGAAAWKDHKTYPESDTTTELHVIHNIEFSTYVANRDKISLTCVNGPGSRIAKQPDTMKWM